MITTIAAIVIAQAPATTTSPDAGTAAGALGIGYVAWQLFSKFMLEDIAERRRRRRTEESEVAEAEAKATTRRLIEGLAEDCRRRDEREERIVRTLHDISDTQRLMQKELEEGRRETRATLERIERSA